MNIFKQLAIISTAYGGFSYLGGMFVYLQLLEYGNATTSNDKLTIISDNAFLTHITTLHIYILFSLAIILLATYCYQTTKNNLPTLSLLSLITGIVWATILIASGFITLSVTTLLLSGTPVSELMSAWPAIELVSNALGGGNELIGSIFTGLVSLTLYKASRSSLATSLLGLAVLVGGVISALPYLTEIGIGIFVISQVLWFFTLARDLHKQT